MKILCHKYDSDINEWSAVAITSDYKRYDIHIQLNKAVDSDASFYTGMIVGKDNSDHISFGYSTYYNQVRYILEAMKLYLNGERRHIILSRCTSKPDSIIPEQTISTNTINIANLTKEIRNYFRTHTKEEILKDWEAVAEYDDIEFYYEE